MNLAALSLTIVLASGAGDRRLLLCRPRVEGDPALARGGAVADAARGLPGRFLDYGAVCDDAAEGARAARRAGLGHAVTATATGTADASAFTLTLADASAEKAVAERALRVPAGADAAGPLREALVSLAREVPAPPERGKGAGPWIAVGAGAAALAAGAVLGVLARSSADARDRAATRGDWAGYVNDDAAWRTRRTASGVALGAGAAAVAAGLAWRFAF